MAAEITPGNANVCFRCPARNFDYQRDIATCDEAAFNERSVFNHRRSRPTGCPKDRSNGYTPEQLRAHLRRIRGG